MSSRAEQLRRLDERQRVELLNDLGGVVDRFMREAVPAEESAYCHEHEKNVAKVLLDTAEKVDGLTHDTRYCMKVTHKTARRVDVLEAEVQVLHDRLESLENQLEGMKGLLKSGLGLEL